MDGCWHSVKPFFPSLVSDVFLTEGSRVTAATVASTAIAAAQWAVTQVTCSWLAMRGNADFLQVFMHTILGVLFGVLDFAQVDDWKKKIL